MATPRILRFGLIVLLLGALGAGTTRAVSVAAADGATISWSTKKRTFADGRSYYARVPSCSPADSAACRDFLGRQRAVVIYFHAAGAAEDADTAAGLLGGFHAMSRDTIFVFAVSKDGSKRWDAGFCCTSEPVNDVGYAGRVIDNLDGPWAVDRRRIGATGLSNGGMFALRLVCERPDLVAGAVALAAVYDGPCDVGQVRVAQWHGALDTTVPLHGGTVTILGSERTVPPVVALGQRMAAGSVYQLRVLPRHSHSMSWTQFKQSTRWLLDNLRG